MTVIKSRDLPSQSKILGFFEKICGLSNYIFISEAPADLPGAIPTSFLETHSHRTAEPADVYHVRLKIFAPDV